MCRRVILLPLILLLAVATTLSAEDKQEAVADSKAIYYAMSPPILVNLLNSGKRKRYMRVSVQLMTRRADVSSLLEENDPVLRHELIMLLSAQDAKEMNIVSRREAVRAEALSTLNKALSEVTGMAIGSDTVAGNSHIEAVYFSDFIIQ